MIVLISDKKELLLPTVVSRCSEVRFRPLSISDTKDIILRNSGVDDATAGFLAYFSQGSPGVALRMASEGLSERRASLTGMVASLDSGEHPECMGWDTENKDELIEDMDTLIMLLRDTVFEKEGMADMVLDRDLMERAGKRVTQDKGVSAVYRAVEKLIGLKSALIGNVNPKIVAQALPGIMSGE
jgi:DNA polymerase III subunit delta'